MKRKITSFPSAAQCPNVIPAPSVFVAASTLIADASAAQKNNMMDTVKEFAPSTHDFTINLIPQVAEFQSSLPTQHILDCRTDISGTLIELTIHAGKLEGYGAVPWLIVIGGSAFDDDASPVCIRFAEPISMIDVDDTGKIHSLFTEPYKLEDVTLPWLADRLVLLLQGSLHSRYPHDDRGDSSSLPSNQFEIQQDHCYRKLSTIRTYRGEYAHSQLLVGESAQLLNNWLSPGVAAALENDSNGRSAHTELLALATQMHPGIFAFDLFLPEFCDLLVREVETYENSPLPRRRPNTMNNYGLIVNEIGMHRIMSEICSRVIRPLAQQLFPNEAFCHMGAGLDHHHSFVVQYRAKNLAHLGGGDEGLDMHQDSSEVTLNICLGKDGFEYQGLVFCGQTGSHDVRQHKYSHVQRKGQAVLHLGRQRHGAGRISSGERLNLIIWARNSSYRCAAASGLLPPDGYPRQKEHLEGIDRICLSAANDSDFVERLASMKKL